MTRDLPRTTRKALPLAMFGLIFGLAACEAPSPTTAAAPAAPAAAPAASAGGLAAPASLTADERVIWNSLTDEAKREALEFIQNGGTLTQFVAV